MTKEQLREFRGLGLEVEQLRGQLEEMEARIYAPRGQKFSTTPRGPGGNGRTMDDLAAAHIRLQDLYNGKLLELETEQAAIESSLDVLTLTERQVIRARYFEGLSWAKVCEAVHFEWAQTHRIHASALRKLSAV